MQGDRLPWQTKGTPRTTRPWGTIIVVSVVFNTAHSSHSSLPQHAYAHLSRNECGAG